ncbi:MAG: hypothetical protein HZB21_04715 [Deltaproteobacteria bacterium]|nr:hypothetical protein [Deltaproteobacteria bacterium]
MKTILTIILFFAPLLSLPATLSAADDKATDAAVIVSVRAGAHRDFHRFVVELSRPVEYTVERIGVEVTLRMKGVDMKKPLRETPSTGLFRVKGAVTLAGEKGAPATGIKIAVKKGSSVKDSTRKNPYRIVLDVYPAKTGSAGNASKTVVSHKIEETSADKSMGQGPPRGEAAGAASRREPSTAVVKDGRKEVNGRGVADFNIFDGWRWEYRRKIIGLLKDDLEKGGAVPADILRQELGIASSGKKTIVMDGAAMAAVLKDSGEPEKAALLNGIVRFFDEDKDPASLEDLLRTHQGRTYETLGWFLLASYYERNGFNSEAGGYYARIISSGSKSPVYMAAIFCKARLLFFDGKYEEAKKWFQKPLDAGFKGADMWLANTLFIKGETADAWRLYSVKPPEAHETLDSVTLLSLADINLQMGNFNAAQRLYGALLLRHQDSAFISAYLGLRSSDVSLAEGRREDAAKAYFRIKEGAEGEGLALASLSLADLLAGNNDHASLKKAEKYYRDVAEGGGVGSEFALLDSASIGARLGRYEEALSALDSFIYKYTTSRLRMDAGALKGRVISRWLSALYEKGDYYGTVNLYYRHGLAIPFGKKAETFLLAGKAFVALSLYGEAVGALNGAIKIGRDSVAEEAYVSLASAYLGQRDADAVERLVKAFKARYPQSAHNETIDGILIRALYMKGDYKPVAASPAKDPETAMLKASALYRLRSYKDALAAYEKVLTSMARRAGTGADASGGTVTTDVYLGIGDSAFMSGDYEKAVHGFKAAVKEMKDAPDGRADDRAWALYRIVQSCGRLGKADEKRAALKELLAIKNEIGETAGPLFKEAADFRDAGRL